MEPHDDRHYLVNGRFGHSLAGTGPGHDNGPIKGGANAMRVIRTVPDLVKELSAHSGGGYEEILKRVDIPFKELETYCRWNDRHYTRTCITRTNDFELLLICYEAGQRTSIHDYDSQEAWIHPVLGMITEERFELDRDGQVRLVKETVLDRSSYSHLLNGHSIHRYINPGTGRAVTLNLYAKPLKKWKVYDERSGGGSTMPISDR